ncbi:zinc finger MYM-type protein 1-like [Montipora foliosa]|uniref:zinc finger MYM-type protein 1-like n=1 Tax=Montipora foliosa TaxID=591990 RepID=UPI0035F1F921
MSLSKSRKRLYRYRVKCEECVKEFDSDYVEAHSRIVHSGRKVRCLPVVESSQLKLSGFFSKSSAAVESPGQTQEASLVGYSPESEKRTISSTDETVAMGDLESIDQNASIRDFQKPSEPITPIDKGIQSDLRGIAEIEQESSTSPTLITMVPKQPVLPEYPGTKFSRESFTRRFPPDWYKEYPWLSYDVEKDVCVCFACIEFGKDASFVFKNWKKPSKLTKHSQSENHVSCMTKLLQFKAMERKNSSVLQQLSSAHQEQVTINRKYLQVIVECLIFTAMQNIAVRGHEESRKDIWEVSDINRGTFLELLHLRCKDLPWLQSKLQSQLQLHAQWTSPSIQNELLAIVSDLVLESFTTVVRKSGYFAIIMDETSDISRTEEVSLCLRYVINGETKETFVGFFATASTEGEVLYELAKTAINKLDLRLENIIAECFDGAANMSGIRKGLATRMKECSPLGIYVHCYGHLLNLALQDTMTENETLRNAPGTIQSLYNFFYGSTKHHALFKDMKRMLPLH